MNNLKIIILESILKKYKNGNFSDLQFLILITNCLENYKNR